MPPNKYHFELTQSTPRLNQKKTKNKQLTNLHINFFLIEPDLKDATNFFSLNCCHEHGQNFFKNALDLVT
jgi:hypothetical protein